MQVIRQWVDAGMHRTQDGYYISTELDLYKHTNGRPTVGDRKLYEETMKKQEESPKQTADKSQQQPQQNQPDRQTPENSPAQQSQDKKPRPSSTKTLCGHTMEEIRKMPIDQIWKLLMNCNEI